MSQFNRNILVGASGAQGYKISRSVRLRSSASAYFSRTFGTPTDNKKWTISFWMKRGALDARGIFGSGVAPSFLVFFDSSNRVDVRIAGTQYFLTTPVYRDPSAWYHFQFVFDSANATQANRIILYINGVQQSASVQTCPLNQTTGFNASSAQSNIGYISGWFGTSADYFDGYLTEINFIDGQALTPSSFGDTNSVTGVWQPKKYVGTYGTNGFYLNFSDNSAATATTIGKDYSGNGNNWTPNNISVTAGATYDSMIDTPTPYADGGNGRGNYAVLNPLSKTGQTVSNGNLTYSSSVGTSSQCAAPTFAVGSSGKWYWEVQITSTPQNQTEECVGVVNDIGTPASLQRAYNSAGQYFDGSSWTAYGSAWSVNDVIGIAIDVDNSQITFYKNNTSQGTKTWAWSANGNCSLRLGSSTGTTYQVNFGQRPFAYTPPTGFKALNTQNLPEPTIKKGNQYFDATTYTGNGSTQSIVNSGGMQPDFVWAKNRATTTWNSLQDVIRGATKELYSNATDAEATYTNTLTSFNSNGFSVGNATAWNGSGNSIVAWQWKAGGTPAVTNTAGSITSTVSANTTSGFSVVTYTGTGANATVGHGLGVAPKMIFVKARNSAYEWKVWHTNLSSGYQLKLNNTDAQASDPTCFTTTLPTSTVFSVGTNVATNVNSQGLVAYCFAEVAGYSKFGSYTGNGSADGPFVYCGFRPKYVMIKGSSTASTWRVIDTTRSDYNIADDSLSPNESTQELANNTSIAWDILSNGFKLRTSYVDENQNGATYIYAAFAENPFKNALAR